jgi:hypothetical protein
MQDLRLAASKLTGAARRAFQAEMTLKYCRGSARLAATILGWSREAVAGGVAAHRTGILCLGAQAACSGRKRWEEHAPEAAAALRQLAEAHAQQAPTFRTTLAYTRLTAKAAGEALRAQGVSEEQLPSPSPMAEVLNRRGYRLRKVIKAKPQKKSKQTDAIFANRKKDHPGGDAEQVKRLSMACQATVNIGAFSRGGQTRGAHKASEHDLGCKEQDIPCGIVDEAPAPL